MTLPITDLLQELASRGIKIAAEGGQLRIRAAKDAFDDDLRARLGAAKGQLLAYLSGPAASAVLPVATPDPANCHEPFALTEIQEAYFIGATSGIEGGGSYHYYLEFACENMDFGRLQDAWAALIARHDMLRAVIVQDGLQQVLPDVAPYQMVLQDAACASDPQAVLAATRARLAHRKPDLGRWPISEIEGTRLPGGVCHIHVSLGLIMLDSFSMMLLFQEWQQLYNDPSARLPDLPLTFRNYVLAERQLPGLPAYSLAQSYWRARVPDLPPAPDLPRALSAKPLSEGRFFRLTHDLHAIEWGKLKAAAQRHGVTPSGLLLTAFSLVLASFGSSRQFTLNLTLFNRLPLGPGVDRIIGDFTSVMPLAVDLAAEDSFAGQARALNRQLQDDLDQRAYPGVSVLRDWARHLGATGRPLAPVVFSSTLVLDTAEDFSLNHLFGGKLVSAISQTPQCSLDHQVMEDEGALIYHWDVAEGVYPSGLVEAMFDAYGALLHQLAQDDAAFDQRFAVPAPVDQVARHKTANATDAPVPPVSLVDAFLHQAALQGDAPAVISAEGTLSYRELEAAARALAETLLAAHVAVEEAVGICLPKGVRQVVAVLGILMAGGVYVPLDPDAPQERNRQILHRAGARLVLGDNVPGLTAIAVDPAARPKGRVTLPEIRTDQLAYILFTSGSTGAPKGVMIPHRAVVNRMSDVVRRFGLTAQDRAIGLTALHHDLSVFDIFGMLGFAGGTLILPAVDEMREPARWAGLMQRHGVTLWNSVPAFMGMLADHLDARGPAPQGLRWVILSGDFIPVGLPDRIRDHFGHIEIIAAGGPTETTVWDICHCLGAVDRSLASIPYGRPMTNARYFVLRPDLTPCPDWVVGELCIAGTGLARGYVGDADLTERKFITHPETGERLYLSGDLGYWLPGGMIAITGRSDFQTKINGQRIEIGEIEAALEDVAGVARAVVTADGNPAVLTAHVVLSPPPATAPATEMKLQQLPLRPPVGAGAAIALPAFAPVDPFARQSHRQFTKAAVPFDRLAGLLSCLAATEVPDAPLPKRSYPSAGSLYPVQVWLHVREAGVAGLAAGLYFFDPRAMALHRVADDPGDALYFGVNAPLLAKARFTLFLIGRTEFIEPAYPGAGRDFCLIEAGHMAQELARAGAGQGIGLCPLGRGIDEAALLTSLGLMDSACPIYMLAGGMIAPEWSAEWQEYSGVRETWETALRQALRACLPRHMEPQRFVRRQTLPLSANGKVDRKALMATAIPQEMVAEFSTPTTEDDIERTLAGLLGALLGSAELPPTRPFFELGATSLTLVQLRGRITVTFGVELPMAELFGAPTVRSLAGVIRSVKSRGVV